MDRLRENTRSVETQRPLYNGVGIGFRVMLYSHDTFGLGHLSRNLKIASALKAAYPELSVLIATGSPQAHQFTIPDGTDYIKLPSVHKVNDEGYAARYLGITFKRILAVRRSVLLETVRNYEPHILLVDHAPLGMKREIVPCLEWIAANNDKSRAILGLRDILDSPSSTIESWTKQGIFEIIRNLYNRIFIYGMPTIFDPVAEYDFPDDIAFKTRYCGFITTYNNDGSISNEPEEAQEKLVLVTIGGGDGGETVIDDFLKVLRRKKNRSDHKSVILTGPFLSQEKWEAFQKQAEEVGASIFRYVSDPGSLMKRSALVISTGGYNTMTDILSFASQAVVVPRILYRKEQLIRAQRFGDLGLIRFIHPDDLTPESLGQAIEERLSEPDEKLAEARADNLLWLDGASRLARYIGESLAEIEKTKEKAVC
ncbi:MAG: glycosyltransferase [candidate division Zixibacteria bacterium]